MKKQKRESLTISNLLLNEIREGLYKASEMLPAETDLAASMGISRTQLRDALSILEQNGFITRRRGIGSTINRQVLRAVTRVDLEVEFLDLVRNAGYEANSKLLAAEVTSNDEVAASFLGVAAHTPILEVSRLIYADDRPVIHCCDHISFERIKDYQYTIEDLRPPIFHFVEKFCHTEIFMNLTEIKPMLADEELSSLLEIEVGDPMLRFNEVAYNIDNEIVLYSQESYVDGIFNHQTLRKKI
jgi:GntR family transcriptional regulator